MQKKLIFINRYDAEDGKVFDWVEPHYHEDDDGNQIQDHLYAKTLYLSETDDISNYVEVEKPEEE